MKVRITQLPRQPGDEPVLKEIGNVGDSYEEDQIWQLLEGRLSLKIRISQESGVLYENLD